MSSNNNSVAAIKARISELLFPIKWKMNKRARKEWETAVAYAMEAHKRLVKEGKQDTLFYVLPDENKKLKVYNEFYIRQLIKRNQMSKKAKPRVVKDECFFFTPKAGNGYRKITPEEVLQKQKEWLAYSKKWKLHSKNGAKK